MGPTGPALKMQNFWFAPIPAPTSGILANPAPIGGMYPIPNIIQNDQVGMIGDNNGRYTAMVRSLNTYTNVVVSFNYSINANITVGISRESGIRAFGTQAAANLRNYRFLPEFMFYNGGNINQVYVADQSNTAYTTLTASPTSRWASGATVTNPNGYAIDSAARYSIRLTTPLVAGTTTAGQGPLVQFFQNNTLIHRSTVIPATYTTPYYIWVIVEQGTVNNFVVDSIPWSLRGGAIPRSVRVTPVRKRTPKALQMDVQRAGYKATAKNLKYLRKYKRGESIGFTMKASLKAKGLIPRESRKAKGRKIVSEKYRG
jgi:hypothetical protein